MRIIIINMPSAEKRLQFQQDQMKKLGLEFERFEAITANTLPNTFPNNYWDTWERPLGLGERACLLSHRTLWTNIETSGKPALILEDDVLLSSKLPALLQTLDEMGANPNQYQHLSLEVRNRKKLVAKRFKELSNPRLNIHRMYQDRTGAAAYILWPQGATELLKHTKKRAGLADAMISSAYKMNAYQIEPACALQFDMCKYYDLRSPFETKSATYGTLHSDKPHFKQRMLYRFRRFKSQLSLGFRHLSNALKSERRHIKLDISDFNHSRQ